MFFSCGESPSGLPEEQFGSLQISTYQDTIFVDNMAVTIDGNDLGIQANPYLTSNLLTGRHLVSVAKTDPRSPIDFSSIPKEVTINHKETTDVSFALTKFAPNFTLNNLNDNPVSLNNYKDQVVLLVFFTHT